MSDIVEKLLARDEAYFKATGFRFPELQEARDELTRLYGENAALRADMASLHDSLNKAEQDNEAIRAREAELVEALGDLAEAARNACDARKHPPLTSALFEADAILAKARAEKGETT